MSRDVTHRADRDEALDEILAAYLKAVDAGSAPDRTDLFAQHADLEAELRAFFTEQDDLDRFTDGLRPIADAARVVACLAGATNALDSLPATPAGASLPVEFGNYQLQEIIACGGMGIIYKAMQRPVHRAVALKMILGGQGLSSTELRRFRNEAEAVASLDHRHIVPIYDVGEQAGQPYFAMKLMEGGSLAEHLQHYVAEPRAAAALLASVARAVHYAHQHGILHRDLKPSNVLLDGEGQPHVTDFGLSKRLSDPASGSDVPELTASGAILGTPRYMAPEQTDAKREAITTATDVYGLGAILYALLTGKPPFQESDMLEVLEAVRQREPDSPAKHNPRVERDLELICLKCLRKEPAQRYASAAAVAEELERYLAGLPLLHTRPVPARERLWRWYRRHKLLASMAGLLVLSLVTISAVSTVAAVRLSAANERERRDRLALEAANQQQRQSRQRAIDVANEFLTRVSESEQLKAHGLERLRRDLLMRARDFWEQFTREEAGDPQTKADQARACLALGRISVAFEENGRALELYQQAGQIFRELAEGFLDEKDYQDEQAQTHVEQAFVYQRTAQFTAARAQYQDALRIRERLLQDNRASRRFRESLAKTLFASAQLNLLTEHGSDALADYERARSMFEELSREEPANPRYQQELASVYQNVGVLHLTAKPTRRYELARTNFEKALPILEQLTTDFPLDPDYQSARSRSYHHLGMVYRETQHPEQAGDAYRKAAGIAEHLVRDHSNVPSYRFHLATLLHGWGTLYYTKGRIEEAKPLMERGLTLCQELVQDYSDVRLYREELWRTTYDSACFYALWSVHVAKDATLPASDRSRLSGQYAEQAVGFLRKSRGIGFVNDRTMLTIVNEDDELRCLRQRDDYKKLVADLDKSASERR